MMRIVIILSIEAEAGTLQGSNLGEDVVGYNCQCRNAQVDDINLNLVGSGNWQAQVADESQV
jgi:hypothetical protein